MHVHILDMKRPGAAETARTLSHRSKPVTTPIVPFNDSLDNSAGVL
jgi:hypothetical protein